ncbi:MAG TPA: tyrosine-type recombinase/integrase [Streptosporangiaceae bacterium]|nr:tyrosine-type recombinase/integrase [Streptosporangiaceae bacterium]
MTGPALLPGWEQLAEAIPGITVPMRRYLEQVACVLRPGSVSGADLALRSFAAFLTETSPRVTSLTLITRRHIEDFKPWLAARPGQNKPRLTTATIAHRLGTLRMFFVRIEEWGWEEAPPRVPMFPGDLPRQDHPLPKALDDAAAAKLLRAAQADRRMLVRVTVEMLLRTGLRVSEFTSLQASAVVLIGAGPWLHVPVGKLREDRYLPLHPQLVTLIDGYRARHVPADHPLLLPRENGRPLDRHTVTRMINKAGAAAGLPHIHPHQLRHTLATQAINRGMSLEAIAALLGHRSLDMTLRYAKIASRTVPMSTSPSPRKSKHSTASPPSSPPTPSAPRWPGSAASTTASSATAGAPGPRNWTAPSNPSAKPAPTSRPASSSGLPWPPSTTTPRPRTRPAASNCSPSSSPRSTTPKHHDQLDSDHPHNAELRMSPGLESLLPR